MFLPANIECCFVQAMKNTENNHEILAEFNILIGFVLFPLFRLYLKIIAKFATDSLNNSIDNLQCIEGVVEIVSYQWTTTVWLGDAPHWPPAPPYSASSSNSYLSRSPQMN